MSAEDRVPRVTYQDGSPDSGQEIQFAPRMCMVEDFDHHDVSSVRSILDAGSPSDLYGAATAWDTLADQLADLMGTINSITQPAKDSWSGEQAADDFHADLRRVYENATNMRNVAQQAAAMARDSGDTLSNVKEHFVDSDEHFYNPTSWDNNDHAKDSLRDLIAGYTNASAYGPDSLTIQPTKIGGNIVRDFTPVTGPTGTGPGGARLGGGQATGGYGDDGGSIGDPSFFTSHAGLPADPDDLGDGLPIDSDPNAAPVIGDGLDPMDPDGLWDADDLDDWDDGDDVWDDDGYDSGTALAGFDPVTGGPAGAGGFGGPGGPGIQPNAPGGFSSGGTVGSSGAGMSPLSTARPGAPGQPGGPGGMMPPAGMGAGGGKSEKERERTTWLVEDQDVWTAGDNLPPPVIGADAVADDGADEPRPRRPRRPRRM